MTALIQLVAEVKVVKKIAKMIFKKLHHRSIFYTLMILKITFLGKMFYHFRSTNKFIKVVKVFTLPQDMSALEGAAAAVLSVTRSIFLRNKK